MMNHEQIKKFISLENVMTVLLLGTGWVALGGISSNCTGFGFLGITLLVLGVAQFIFSCTVKFVPVLDTVIDVLNVCCYLPLHIVLTSFGIFALVVSSSGGGESIPGRSYKEYNLELYSKWMQHKVNDVHNWESYYKKAIVEANVCNKFSKDYEFDTLDEIHSKKLTPFQSSCCMPPEGCGFDYTSPTIWMKPENNGTNTNVDCKRWDNEPNTLCYNCQTCKAAFVQDVTIHYFISGILLLLPAAQVVLSCLCYSCALCSVFGVGTYLASRASSDDSYTSV